MLQAQSAWKALDGADCISSEDESWLNHPGFHLSDSEEDEIQSVGVQYVRAVTAIKRASLQLSSLEPYGQKPPLLLEAPREAASENNYISVTVPSARVDAEKQHTMHALEMLLPQELQVTQLNTQAGPKDMQSALPSDAQASASVANKSAPTVTPSHPDLAVAASNAASQQQLPSPVSKVATKPFPGPPPVTLVQQQAQQQPLWQDQLPQLQQSPDLAATAAAAVATTVGLLELSLSAEQIALLQAAADNAQRYLDRDAATAGSNAEQVHSAASGPTADGATQQHGADWDMQSAIVEAFKSILPADASAEATPPAAASASARASALSPNVNPTLASSVAPTLAPRVAPTLAPPVAPTLASSVAPTHPLQGSQTEPPRVQTHSSVSHHSASMSQGHLADHSRPAPQHPSSALQPVLPQHAGAANASLPLAAGLQHKQPGHLPSNVASSTAVPASHAQAPADLVQPPPVPGNQASQQPHAPHGPLQDVKVSKPLLAAGTSGAVLINSIGLPSKQAPIPKDLNPGVPPPAPPTANASGLSIPTAAAAPIPTAAATHSAAANSQALSDADKGQIITAPTYTPIHVNTAGTQPASVATGSAATKPLPEYFKQASPVIGILAPPSAAVHAPAASTAPQVATPGSLDPFKPLYTPPVTAQTAFMPLSGGSSATLSGETKGTPLGFSAGTPSGTAPQSQGSIFATAATPPATAAVPPATAAVPPATAAAPPATAAALPAIAAAAPATAAAPPATASTLPATAVVASAPAVSQLYRDKPSPAVGSADTGPLHSTAPSAIMRKQSLAALTTRKAQTPQMPVDLTPAPETSTVSTLLPSPLSTGVLPSGDPGFSWVPRVFDSVAVPQLPTDLTLAAAAHDIPGTATATKTVMFQPKNEKVPARSPFQPPAGLTSSPAAAGLTPSAPQGLAGIPASPSLFSPAPAQAAAPGKKKASKASKKRKAGHQAIHGPNPPQAGAKQLPASTEKKRKAERQAIPSPNPPQSGAQQVPASPAAALPGPPSCTPGSAAKQPPGAPTPNHKRHQPDPNRDPIEFVSPELTAMRNAHGGHAIPMVGVCAVQPHLADIKSLVTAPKYMYKLTDIINAIGHFAVGREQQQEIFLGDLHNSYHHQQQIVSIANLFGVKARPSANAERFHQKFRLTQLERSPNAGILTRHGDMLMYFIVELSELSKLNKQQGKETYQKEHKATLELANAVGRKLKGADGDFHSLNKGCQVRLQQLADEGYLAVKRTKQDRHQIKPARYPGWEGRPRYGPRTSLPLQPPTAVLHQPPTQRSHPTTSTPASLPKLSPPAAAPTAPASLQISQGLQSKASSAAISTQATAADPLPLLSQIVPRAMSTPMPQSMPASIATVTPALALSPLSAVQNATAGAQLIEPSSGHSQQQPVPSDTTAALVAAVGPMFESFVAQTAAVVTDPSISLQTLAGSITQELAAAIAIAAVQVVAQRRQQLLPTGGQASADIPLCQAAPSSGALVNAPILVGKPAVVDSTALDRMPGNSTVHDPVDASKTLKSVIVRESKQGQSHSSEGVRGTGKAATQGTGIIQGTNEGYRKPSAAESDVAVTPSADQNQKRVSSNAKDQQSGGTKRQKTGVTTPKRGMASEGHVVLSKHASRSDTSSSDRAQRDSAGKQTKVHQGSGRGSPGSRGSKGSRKSPPKQSGSLDAASQFDNQQAAPPQAVGRNIPGSSFQHGVAPALLPSRLSDNFGSGPSVMSVPLPFAPHAAGNLGFRPSNAYTDMMLSPQVGMANGFMPLMPSSPGDWHMQPPALNNFPMAAHFLPGIDEAPDFSPVN